MGANLEITDTGIVSPDSEEIKTAIQNIFINAFGTDLSLDDATPQGVLIDDLTQLKQASNSVLLYLANQFNPETASGIFQDALANLYFIQRHEATRSIVICRCIGIDGTVLNGLPDNNNPTRVPAMAQSTGGDIFECIATGVIGNPVTVDGVTTYTTPGYVDLPFQSKETGPIACRANTVNKIYQSVIGWDSVNNSSSGTVGKEEETREAFEQRRKESLALQATGSLAAVQAGIANLDGVTNYKVWENITDSSVTVNGVTLSPHSIWLCINSGAVESSSGDVESIAKVIYDKKSAGCDTTNTAGDNTRTCTYTDNLTGVTYTYYYDYPKDIDVYIKVLVQSELPDETVLAMKQAIWDNFNGVDENQTKAISIGDTVYAGRFFNAIAGLNTNALQIQVSESAGSGYANSLSFDMNELPVVGDRPTASSAGTNIIVEVDS